MRQCALFVGGRRLLENVPILYGMFENVTLRCRIDDGRFNAYKDEEKLHFKFIRCNI